MQGVDVAGVAFYSCPCDFAQAFVGEWGTLFYVALSLFCCCRHHKRAVRQVCYHQKYPLFASASDDGSVIVCHGRVYR